MNIKKINKLRNVGILDENSYINNFLLFKNEENKQNKQIKTIYTNKVLIRGDNGTGKSTLSNIFRSIEEKDKTYEIISNITSIEKSDNIDIEIELSDGTVLRYDDIQKKWINNENVIVRVFNDDYIKENINLKEFNQNKINGKFETKEIKISKEKMDYEESKNKINELLEEKEIIDKLLKKSIDNANLKIKHELDQYCFLETDLEKYSEKNDEKLNIEKQKELERCINGFKKIKNLDEFNSIKTNNFINMVDEKELIENLKYKEDNIKIDFMNQLLNLSVDRKKWLDVGMQYIENDKCPFCEADISNNNFISCYRKYSESNNKKIEKNLLNCKEELERLKNDKIKDIKILIAKNKEYSDVVKLEVDISDEEIKKYNDDLESIIHIIDGKIKDINKEIDPNKIEEIKIKITTIDLIIKKSKMVDYETEKINKAMLNAKKELSNLRIRIKKLKKEVLEYSMRESLVKRKNLLKEIEKEEIRLIEKKKMYEKIIEDADLTIKEMNSWLDFFGMNKYRVNKDFNLIYKENNISEKMYILSTGEISALVFSYYLSNLVMGLTSEEKEKLIIVIDDPVNSLDYNKIFSFATAIKIIQKRINESKTPQLFLFTHNTLFFNILVQTNWMKGKNAKVFELYKNGEILKIKETKNYKDSLFIIQLSEIIKCANSEINDINIEKSYLYNDIRSVIENLCYLLNPKYVENDDKYNTLKEIFDIEYEEYMKLDYIVNNNSHNEPMLNIEKWFDSQLLHDACKVISSMIQTKFNHLYDYCLKYNT